MSRAFTFKQQCRRSDQIIRASLAKITKPKTASYCEDEKTHHKAHLVELILDKQTDIDLLPEIVASDSGVPEKTGDGTVHIEDTSGIFNEKVEVHNIVKEKNKTEMIPSSECREYLEDIQLDVAHDIPLNSEIHVEVIEESIGGYCVLCICFFIQISFFQIRSYFRQ